MHIQKNIQTPEGMGNPLDHGVGIPSVTVPVRKPGDHGIHFFRSADRVLTAQTQQLCHDGIIGQSGDICILEHGIF